MVIDLKVLFKNKTKYTKEIYKEFLEFHTKRYHLQATIFNVIVIALILFLIVLQIAYRYYSIAILSTIIFTGFCLYRYFHPILVVKKELKGETISQEKSFTFKFYEKYFKVSDNINQEKSFTFKFYEKYFKVSDNINVNKVKYLNLRKGFETKDFFYLYLDKTHAFIINKKNFSIGKSIDFSEFIKKKCFLRYKKVE